MRRWVRRVGAKVQKEAYEDLQKMVLILEFSANNQMQRPARPPVIRSPGASSISWYRFSTADISFSLRIRALRMNLIGYTV